MQLLALHLNSFIDYARLRGMPYETIASGMSALPTDGTDPSTTIDEEDFYVVIERIFAYLNDDLFGIRVGNHLNLNTLGAIYRISLKSVTIQEALYVCQAYLKKTLPLIQVVNSMDDDSATIRLYIENDRYQINRIILETILMVVAREIKIISGEETEVGIDIAYSTAVFEKPEDAPSAWKGVIVLPSAPGDSRGAFLSPIENNQWIVSVGGNHGDAPPGDMEGFLAFVKTLRTTTIYDAIKGAKPVGQIVRYLLPCSARRHFEAIQRLPRGLLAIGDAICRFNPVFGQGMSVAAQEAVILNRLLGARAGDMGRDMDPLDGLASAFFAEIQCVLETPWGIATSDFIYPKTRGERPANFEQRLQFNKALVRLGAQDASIHKLMTEVNHLLKPQSALREPEVAERVAKLMATPA